MIANNISFKANPIQKKGTEAAQTAAKTIKDKLPGFHDYVGSRTVFPPETTKAAEAANELAKKANRTEDVVEFTNPRAPHAEGITKEMDEFTRLNKMYADAQDKPTIINGKEIDIQA